MAACRCFKLHDGDMNEISTSLWRQQTTQKKKQIIAFFALPLPLTLSLSMAEVIILLSYSFH